jgi:hypothetical protein
MASYFPKRSNHGKDESSGEDDANDQCTRDGCGTGSEAAAIASGSGKGPGLRGSRTGATGEDGTVDGDAAGGALSGVNARAWFCSPAQAAWGASGDAAEGILTGTATVGLWARDRSQRAVLYQSSL